MLWRSVLTLGLVCLLPWTTFVFRNQQPGPAAPGTAVCRQTAGIRVAPGLAALAVETAPADWARIVGTAAWCTAPAATTQTLEATTADSDADTHPFSWWDHAGQRLLVTRIAVAPSSASDSGVAPTRRWIMTTDSPNDGTLTVTAQPMAPGILAFQVIPSQPESVSAIGLCVPAMRAEHFFGLGERAGRLDLAGAVVRNWVADQARTPDQSTSYAPTPFLLSSRGYGLLLDTAARAVFDLRSERGCYHVRVDTSQLRLYLIAGPNPQTILERHAGLVGLPPLPPRWAFGVWKNLIGGPAEVERSLAQLRANGVPLDAVWIYDAVDTTAGVGWPWPIYAPIPTGTYPDLQGLVARLHGQGLHVLGYLNPLVHTDSASFGEAQRRGFLVRTADSSPYLEPWPYNPGTEVGYLDFTNPAATAWWQARVTYALTELGFDGAMLDFGEETPVDGRYASGESGALLHNRYPVLYQRATFVAAEAAKPGDTVFLARAGYSGSQPYTTGRFTGDQVRSWEGAHDLASVLPAMLSGSLSGWPYWGPDIAGFMQADAPASTSVDDARRHAAEKELWIRWVQLGALSPTILDMLGMQQDPVGIWTDQETLAIFRGYAQLHRALQPYLYHYAELAHRRGVPILRPLFLNDPADPTTYTLDDEYLIGDEVLVAPILQSAQTTRRVYLPAGDWRAYWTSREYGGPGWVTVAAPLQQIPLFVRVGAPLILPAPDELGFCNAVRGLYSNALDAPMTTKPMTWTVDDTGTCQE